MTSTYAVSLLVNRPTDDLVVRRTPVGPVPPDQPDRLAEAFAVLAEHRDQIVPVVGAGLAIAAGAPSAPTLTDHLREAGDLLAAADADLFEVADALETTHGTAWVNAVVAQRVADPELRPTGVLRNLARLPSGIVATTDYDDAISVAAQDASLEPHLFWGPMLNQGLRTPESGVLHVLHLHGHHSEPDSLILSKATYDAAANDRAIQYTLQALTSQFILVLLGQQLGEREAHVRQNLLWTSEAFRTTGPHRIFLAVDELEREDLDTLASDSTLAVVPFRNHDGTFDVIRLVAQHVGLGLPDDRITLPAHLQQLKTDVFVPIPIYPAGEVTDTSRRQVLELAGTAFGRHIELPRLLGHSRAILFGDPGAGKTQALLEAGRLANRQHVAYLPLGATQEAPPAAAPVDEFISWMSHANTFDPGTERPSRQRLRDTVHLFLLDGLDEVPRQRREHVLRVIDEVAKAHPHQLFVVASRRYSGATESVPDSFATFHLVPNKSWFRRYLDQVDVTDDDLNQVVPPDHPLRDLVHLPIFAVAVADAARDRQTLSRSPVEAICQIARRGLEHTSQLLADPEQLDRWLDVLAVVGEATGTNGLPVATAIDPALAVPTELAPDRELLDHCIGRALVVVDGDTVHFPANIIQEARAARAITTWPGGLDLLRSHALLTLPDGTTGVHPSWRHVVELACHDAGPEFRREVAEYDPRMAARATPPDADSAERDAAIRTLLDWYDHRRVWWTHGSDEAQLRTDLDVVAALAVDPAIRDWAVDWALQRLDSVDRTRRGNAIQLLARLGEKDLVADALPSLLRDPDSVVRRNAAHAHAEQKLEGFADDLRTALDGQPDELEQRSLLAEYIRTGPTDGIADLLRRRWPAGMDSYEATRALEQRFTHREQLQLLVDLGQYAEGWLDHLLSRDMAMWTHGEVGLLATYVGQQPRSRAHSHHSRPILHQHLDAALPILWELDRSTADFLLLDSSTSALEHVASQPLPDQITAEIEHVLHARSTSTSAPTPPTGTFPEDVRADPIAAVRTEGWPALRQLSVSQIDRLLADHPDEDFRAAAEAAWSDALHADQHPIHRIYAIDDGTWQAEEHDDWVLLHLGAHLRLPLAEQDWLRLLQLGLLGEPFSEWLRHTLPDDPHDLLDGHLSTLRPQAARQATEVLPVHDSPTETAVALVRCLLDAEEGHAVERYLSDLADAHRLDALRALEDEMSRQDMLPHLVHAGDCDAEQQLLLEELEEDVPARLHHAGDRHWLDRLQCSASTELLARRIVDAEASDADVAYLAKLHQALHRTAGVQGLAVYNHLMEEKEYEVVPFLWFRRAELRDKLLAETAKWFDEPVAREDLVSRLMAAGS